LLLSNRAGFEGLLPLSQASDGAGAVEALGDWAAAGVKIRSRALLTTMFARLAVADLFLHGIGGARYDEATDMICQRFFGAAPPSFATISGTLRLPIPHGASGDAPAELRDRLRDLTYHPERHLNQAAIGNGQRRTAEALLAEKRRWLQTPKRPENAAERHRGIVAANESFQPLVAAERARTEQALASILSRDRANRVLESREYAFCLFPRKLLDQFLLDFPREVR
jgi:hypothetical protein